MVAVMAAQAYIRARTNRGHGGCWPWALSKNEWGYGRAGDPVLGERAAHRISYRAFVGPIPAGQRVLHDCPGGDNPACCNPEHLWIGDDVSNMRDMVRKGRNADLRGERSHSAKLSWSDVAAIRAASSINVSEWSRQLGVSRRAINLARRGQTWSR